MTTAAITTPPPSANAPGFLDSFVSASGTGFSFHDLLSIVNPLEHIPVVSTIYRAVTGDTIAPAERIAGDALYGGLWGLVSSVANVAFQQITGKDFGDTAIAFIEGQDDTADMAANSAPAPATTASLPTTPDSAGASSAFARVAIQAVPASQIAASLNAPAVSIASGPDAANAPPRVLQAKVLPSASDDAAAAALVDAMNKKGIDPALSRRALAAYQKSLAAPPQPATVSIPTS